jgi:hypothetical protein
MGALHNVALSQSEESEMKLVALIVFALLSLSVHANDAIDLTPTQLEAKVREVTAAQNVVMKRGSTVADVDHLFDLYTDDFTYVHDVYGGTYSRKTLHANTVKYLKDGGYTLDADRYTILRMIPGTNAVAVERRENTGAVHLAVFEFRGALVSRIIEYWK